MSDEPATKVPPAASAADAVSPLVRRKPPALGRGLGALLGEVRREEPLVTSGAAQAATSGDPVSGLVTLPVAAIEPHPEQPRRHFDEAALEELAASIAARGVIQPVIVRPLGGGRYQLVAGERRWRATQRARLHEIPALVRELSEREVMALALIENLQREDLNPIEEARAYHRLAEQEAMTQADIAKMVDKSRSHVANLQRLLSLPEPVIALVESGALSMGHARTLVGVENAAALAQAVVERQMSVRELEKQVRRQSRGEPATPRRARDLGDGSGNADIIAVQTHLEEFLGLPIRIAVDPADPTAGSVTIRYRTLDQLDLVCQRLTGEAI
ncbi:ParB/RepB/Spo0J family partition protein [Novosphingobium piscinae]|uniref:ParB/RepB/Spo0J family partition protein n=1 Tax=Novosphingobium piscinae TaxID=1507448 RepID=A0A7X1G000_9SPHN|nr:ParB/RepB/Spo0J family partition protein [Novosphingobium piscinae]MBC2670066.1 ParB/RepB/Spo0J family partition protein [Novosphingobium piscinae]